MSDKYVEQALRYYVVSDKELNYLAKIASDVETGDGSMLSFEKIKAVCRARPVPEWATHFAGGMNEICPEGPDSQTTVLCTEEIKR